MWHFVYGFDAMCFEYDDYECYEGTTQQNFLEYALNKLSGHRLFARLIHHISHAFKRKHACKCVERSNILMICDTQHGIHRQCSEKMCECEVHTIKLSYFLNKEKMKLFFSQHSQVLFALCNINTNSMVQNKGIRWRHSGTVLIKKRWEKINTSSLLTCSLFESASACISLLVSGIEYFPRMCAHTHACFVHKSGNFISILHLDYFNFSLNTFLLSPILDCSLSISLTVSQIIRIPVSTLFLLFLPHAFSLKNQNIFPFFVHTPMAFQKVQK